MGNCCSDVAGGQTAVGGTGVNQGNQPNAPNEAVDAFLKSRGYQGLYSQIEALGFLFLSIYFGFLSMLFNYTHISFSLCFVNQCKINFEELVSRFMVEL